ncbi:MAG: hypothetical protein R3292_11105 [Alcanivorax sp.]|nr:hypothetical protein [Alcanivorax sp.]
MRLWLLPLFLLLPLTASADKLIGLGYLNGLVGLNLEWAGKHNSFYAMPGGYLISTGYDQKDVRWVAGWRHKMERGLMAEKGFYGGLIVGDLGGESQYERLGAGLEIGHQWVKPYTRWTLSGAVGVLQPLDCTSYRPNSDCNTKEELRRYDLSAEPTAVLGISVSLRR